MTERNETDVLSFLMCALLRNFRVSGRSRHGRFLGMKVTSCIGAVTGARAKCKK